MLLDTQEARPDLESTIMGDVEFKWTKDPDLLLQYFKIREEAYREYLGLNNFRGKLDAIDSHSHELVAVKNDNQVIGGARLTINDNSLKAKLPMESDDFILREVFPEYNLDKNRYCEFSKTLLTRGYRKEDYFLNLCNTLVKKAQTFNTKYIFIIAPKLQTLRYMNIATLLNIPNETCSDISLPYMSSYDGMAIYLSVYHLK